jgi:hypothetical protein
LLKEGETGWGSPVSYLTKHQGDEIKRRGESEEMIPLQKKIYQSMPPEKKLRIALRLYYSARRLKAAALHQHYPGWTEQEIEKKVREIFLYART